MTQNGPDRYHGNGDQDWAGHKARGATFAILKVTQGTLYDTSWYEGNLPRARAAGLVVGGYHMLSGTDGSGAQQADYFLSKAHFSPGDVIPFMDFEASGQGGGSDAAYRQAGVDFVARVHAAGFQCGIYGHERVKALFGDWRRSGADALWVPGDQAHTDAGPPDLWQFGPFTHGPVPSDGGDWSVVLTQLPLIGGDNLSVLSDDQQKFVQGMIRRVNRQGPPAPGGDPQVKAGFEALDAVIDESMASPKPVPGPPGKDGQKGDPGPAGQVGHHSHDFGGHTSPGKAAP